MMKDEYIQEDRTKQHKGRADTGKQNKTNKRRSTHRKAEQNNTKEEHTQENKQTKGGAHRKSK